MERHVELLGRHLDREGNEIFAITPEWPALREFNRALDAAVDHHVRWTPDRRWGLRRQIADTWAYYRQLRAWHIDVAHMHLTTFNGATWALVATRLAGVRIVVCTEHLAPDEPVAWPNRLARFIFVELIDRLICVSEKNREARAARLYTPSEKTRVVVNGVDPDDFMAIDPAVLSRLRRDLRIPTTARVVGSVVRFNPEKGLNYLLDAMPAVLARCPDSYLLLVGDGPLRTELENQATRLGIRERVRFAGFHADPRPYLALMDAFVLPVPVGSMSIGLLEAMAMRRAVIITFGGAGEAVAHEESGLWAPPRDPQALAQSIIRLLENPELARAYGEAARQRVEEQFSATAVARKLSSIYNSV
jgi:glycosyltransferase involved in cell wall biosynthesis